MIFPTSLASNSITENKMYYHRHVYSDHKLIVSYIRTSLSKKKKGSRFLMCLSYIKAYKILIPRTRRKLMECRFLETKKVIYFNVIIRRSLSLTKLFLKKKSVMTRATIYPLTNTHTHTIIYIYCT